ncbi:FAD-dependent pyridine nucleotide-disulfide oxidoreductase [Caldalkalibacillus thermarum TA2.A1]|uniref:FAD-binding protein n=1 Tax=Caldalkalibacillus thermarum (strain TA2.A1) TaxID=986075 RepID=F5L8J9_CALTT|nr:FAD-binding protein [Caldalkalibacillus thermarum]EGL82338.1 FAD-dependent pyridine nucleotide-disulfide oxidoreductase [Caldalkalibacillus thermarum TA2.A1]QZT32900.1 FAD-binding protein [Caldalkalibacillus thermarum TA2.A1]
MYDVIIIGGGIAGGSAAIYTAYGELSTLVLDTEKSQIHQISELRNYPGILQTTGTKLRQTIKEQAKRFGTQWRTEKVIGISKHKQHYTVITEQGNGYEGKYVIIATNLGTELLEDLGISLKVNENVPSGKIKEVVGVQFNGRTRLDRLYVAGLLAGMPSQSVIASGHGVAVAIQILSREKGKPFMWHDV